MASEPRRITLVADELLGYTRTGGIGTATSFLALALGRMGHDIELLYAGDDPGATPAGEWGELYEQTGVRIRRLRRTGAAIEPSYFARMHDVELQLAGSPPDVVITQDLAAPAYTALRRRSLGLGFEDTLFVVYCHGTRRWITDTARKVRVLPGAHAVTILEQASIELADVVVSPSAYLLDWMRTQRWELPATSLVIPYFTRSVATGSPTPRPANGQTAIERIAFFGRLEERKGLKPFTAGLNTIEPALLKRVELDFVGASTPTWPPERIEGLLSERTKRALRGISFLTELDQPDALARLSRRGTLVVMPSLGETFSNAVYECLERGIPFIASNAGAPPELVAREDHDRVLFEPTTEGISSAVRRALSDPAPLRPARPAFDPRVSYDRWSEVVASRPRPRSRAPEPPDAEWTIRLDDGDEPDADLVETLKHAQAASAADVVTCGVRFPSGTERLFFGDPGALGLLANHYGTVALLRRSDAADEPIWPLLARLSFGGAKIVSVPRALVTGRRRPADVASAPEEALAIAQHLDRQLPASLRSLARLTVGLAAAQASAPTHRRTVRSVVRRLARR